MNEQEINTACPRGWPWGSDPGCQTLGVGPWAYQGDTNVRGYKRMEWILCPWVGGHSRDCFRINESGWGIHNIHHSLMDSHQGDLMIGKLSAEKI